MIQITCSACGAQLKVGNHLMGKSFKCPKCGQIMRADVPVAEVLAETEDLPDDDEQEEPARTRPRHKRRKPRYAPCPGCGSTDAERIMWTFWGSFYGPAIFTHVRCSQCGTTYNGRTGRSNLIWAIIFVLVTWVLICLLLGVAGWLIASRLHLFDRGG
jgi:DNA-directed RNA polymerase subunit M/transcription elongation factor TFIIS